MTEDLFLVVMEGWYDTHNDGTVFVTDQLSRAIEYIENEREAWRIARYEDETQPAMWGNAATVFRIERWVRGEIGWTHSEFVSSSDVKEVVL